LGKTIRLLDGRPAMFCRKKCRGEICYNAAMLDFESKEKITNLSDDDLKAEFVRNTARRIEVEKKVESLLSSLTDNYSELRDLKAISLFLELEMKNRDLK
jgi:hypothetical protein